MQVAGSACFVCGKNVGTIPEAIGCTRCETVAHRACAADRSCPSCGEALVAGRLLHAAPQAKAAPVLPREVDAGPQEPDAPPPEIGGSLLVFIVWIAANSVFQIISGLSLAATVGSGPVGIVVLATVGAGAYGGWCSRALAAANRRAPFHVHAWCAVSLMASMVLAIATGSYNGAGRPILAWIICALYLGKSKRVAALYRAGA